MQSEDIRAATTTTTLSTHMRTNVDTSSTRQLGLN